MPIRHFVGKGTYERSESSSSESESEEIEEQLRQETSIKVKVTQSAPSTTALQNTKSKGVIRQRVSYKSQVIDESESEQNQSKSDESSDEDLESESESESDSSDDDSDSSEDEKPKLKSIKFISKNKRKPNFPKSLTTDKSEASTEVQKEESFKAIEKGINRMIKEDKKKILSEGFRVADEDNNGTMDDLDDRDDLNVEAEYEAWKLREFSRLRRDRLFLIHREKERDEAESRKRLHV